MKQSRKAGLIISIILALVVAASVVGVAASFAGFAKSQTVIDPDRPSSALVIGADGSMPNN